MACYNQSCTYDCALFLTSLQPSQGISYQTPGEPPDHAEIPDKNATRL